MKLLCKESMCEIIKANIDSIIDFYLYLFLNWNYLLHVCGLN